MDYIWCLCKAKEPNIHLEAILYTFGGNFGSFQSQKSFGANLPPPVSQCKFQSLFQIGLMISTARSGLGCDDGTGGYDCCSASYKCGEGEGDCDNDNECLGNLLCGTDNCDQSLGFGPSYDCCIQPS